MGSRLVLDVLGFLLDNGGKLIDLVRAATRRASSPPEPPPPPQVWRAHEWPLALGTRGPVRCLACHVEWSAANEHALCPGPLRS
jgi:hypothetical protein